MNAIRQELLTTLKSLTEAIRLTDAGHVQVDTRVIAELHSKALKVIARAEDRS